MQKHRWIAGMNVAAVVVTVTSVLSMMSCDSSKAPTGGNGADTTATGFRADAFESSASCQSCHPDQFEEWSGSMHAYALVDPVFAAVRDAGQSAYANALDGACTQCHSPIGKRSGEIPWGPFELDDLSAPSRDGIGCDLCHTITAISKLGAGGIELTPGDTKFGTTRNPMSNAVHKSEFNQLYRESAYCGACHDLVTDDGFELEATYREWVRGGFAVTGKTCNDCHMPTYVGRATPDSPERTLHRHTFVGGDLALVDFPNRVEQLRLVTEMLQSALTMDLTMPATATRGGQVDLSVSITNDLTGHNVPSGVPFNRQMWLSVIVKDAGGSVIYSSGQLDANDDLMDDNSEFAERDPDLFNAQATMLRADGLPTGNTWDATDLDNPSIAPGEIRVVDYGFDVPVDASGEFTVDVVLRFRSFAPHAIRGLGLHEILPIPIIDMEEESGTITVQ